MPSLDKTALEVITISLSFNRMNYIKIDTVIFQFHFNRLCVWFCACAGSVLVYELSDVGNERVHIEVCESVNDVTVKLSKKEPSENIS